MEELAGKRIVLLLSGGQDSTTCLFWALANGASEVHALSVWYGQRHDAELRAASAVLDVARKNYPEAILHHEQLHIGNVLASSSPLVSDTPLGQYDSAEQLPGGVEPTFVPGRNLLFLTLAANRAASVRADALVTGVCEEDFGGYYDCRRAFIDATEQAVAQGFVGADKWLPILTPLMKLDKASSVRVAVQLPGCMDALAVSHTCYAGENPPCGRCHACHLRARGFAQAGIADPLHSKD